VNAFDPLAPTIRTDLAHEEYAALPGWRWSHIKLMETHSPHAVRHAVDNPDDSDTPSRVKLRAIHAAVLEPDRFDAMFSVYDGVRRGADYTAHLANHPGTSVLNPREYDDIHATADAIRSHPVVRDLMSDGDPEVSVSWVDPETGLPCKGRVDWLGSGGILDLKTCGTVHERAVASLVARNLWHGQLAHYASGLAAHGRHDLPAYIIAAEGKGAQDVAVYQIDQGIPDGALHVGEGIRSRLMRELARCERLNNWPGRHPSAVTLCLPTYALDDIVDEITV
jgi:hypothetical protein